MKPTKLRKTEQQMKPQQSPLSKARDEWLDSDEGQQCCNGTCDGQYLRNRLEGAFRAGANWAARHLVERVKAEAVRKTNEL